MSKTMNTNTHDSSTFVSKYFTECSVPKRSGRQVATWNNMVANIAEAVQAGITGGLITLEGKAVGTIYQQGTKALKNASLWDKVKLTKNSKGEVYWYVVGSVNDPRVK